MASYFKGEVLHGAETDIFTSNMCKCRHLVRYAVSFVPVVNQILRKTCVNWLYFPFSEILIPCAAHPLLRACGQSELELVSSYYPWVLHNLRTSLRSHLRVLKYVNNAIGETDVPEALPEFIIQRRRWLNGSLFAAMYAIAHAGQILRSGHSVTRKCVLMAETVYNVINLVATWFAIVSPIQRRRNFTF